MSNFKGEGFYKDGEYYSVQRDTILGGRQAFYDKNGHMKGTIDSEGNVRNEMGMLTDKVNGYHITKAFGGSYSGYAPGNYSSANSSKKSNDDLGLALAGVGQLAVFLIDNMVHTFGAFGETIVYQNIKNDLVEVYEYVLKYGNKDEIIQLIKDNMQITETTLKNPEQSKDEKVFACKLSRDVVKHLLNFKHKEPQNQKYVDDAVLQGVMQYGSEGHIEKAFEKCKRNGMSRDEFNKILKSHQPKNNNELWREYKGSFKGVGELIGKSAGYLTHGVLDVFKEAGRELKQIAFDKTDLKYFINTKERLNEELNNGNKEKIVNIIKEFIKSTDDKISAMEQKTDRKGINIVTIRDMDCMQKYKDDIVKNSINYIKEDKGNQNQKQSAVIEAICRYGNGRHVVQAIDYVASTYGINNKEAEKRLEVYTKRNDQYKAYVTQNDDKKNKTNTLADFIQR